MRHWQAVVLTPRAGLPPGPVEPFAEYLEHRVRIVNLEELSRRQALEPREQLLTLVVRQESELGPTSQPRSCGNGYQASLEKIMAIAGIELADLSETRAYQDILTKGREEGGQREAASLVLRQLRRRFGSVLAEHDTIHGLTTTQLEQLAEALLDFSSPADLMAWLAECRA